MIDNILENKILNTNLRNEAAFEANKLLFKYQKENDDEKANYYWLLLKIIWIINNYEKVFDYLKNKEYDKSWQLLDSIDIAICLVEKNFDIEIINSNFNLKFIKETVIKYIKIFPYTLFTSRDDFVKKEKCSICGKEISFHNRCEHRKGKLYCGKICYYIVEDIEVRSIALVSDPYDRCCVMKVQGQEYNYSMIDSLMNMLKGPYQEWSYVVSEIKRNEYKNINRNDLCPCGSNKKYKKCCLGTSDELMKFYKFTINEEY